MFQVCQDPNELYGKIYESLSSLTNDSEPIKGSNTFKIKHHICKIQEQPAPAKNEQEKPAEKLKIECDLAVRFIHDGE